MEVACGEGYVEVVACGEDLLGDVVGVVGVLVREIEWVVAQHAVLRAPARGVGVGGSLDRTEACGKHGAHGAHGTHGGGMAAAWRQHGGGKAAVRRCGDART